MTRKLPGLLLHLFRSLREGVLPVGRIKSQGNPVIQQNLERTARYPALRKTKVLTIEVNLIKPLAGLNGDGMARSLVLVAQITAEALLIRDPLLVILEVITCPQTNA